MITYIPNPAAPFFTSVTIPDDGDPEQAGSVNVAFETLADSLSNVRKDLYSKRLIDLFVYPWTGAQTWTASGFSPGFQDPVTDLMTGFQDGDAFVVTVSFAMTIQNRTVGGLRLVFSEDPTGGTTENLNYGGEYDALIVDDIDASSDVPPCIPVTICGIGIKHNTSGFGNTMRVFLQGKVSSSDSGPGMSDFSSPASKNVTIVHVWRSVP